MSRPLSVWRSSASRVGRRTRAQLDRAGRLHAFERLAQAGGAPLLKAAEQPIGLRLRHHSIDRHRDRRCGRRPARRLHRGRGGEGLGENVRGGHRHDARHSCQDNAALPSQTVHGAPLLAIRDARPLCTSCAGSPSVRVGTQRFSQNQCRQHGVTRPRTPTPAPRRRSGISWAAVAGGGRLRAAGGPPNLPAVARPVLCADHRVAATAFLEWIRQRVPSGLKSGGHLQTIARTLPWPRSLIAATASDIQAAEHGLPERPSRSRGRSASRSPTRWW